MAQLPRCVQQAPWKRVLNTVGVGGSSMRGICSSSTSSPASAMIRGSASCAQCLVVLCRSSSSSSTSFRHRVSEAQLSSSSLSERIRVDRLGFCRFSSGMEGQYGVSVSNRVLRSAHTTGLTRLSRLPVRRLSSAEASAMTDGFLKESLLKDAEDKSDSVESAKREAEKEAEKAILKEVEESGQAASEVLSAVELETDGALLQTEVEDEAGPVAEVMSAVELENDQARERDDLVAAIKSKELELQDLRNALKVVDEKQGKLAEEIDEDLLSVAAERLNEQAATLLGFQALDESAKDFTGEVSEEVSSVSDIDREDDLDEVAKQIAEEEPVSVFNDSTASSASATHPWPEWMQFLEQLEKEGHFLNEDNIRVDMKGSTNEDLGLIKRACMSFARERDDIFLQLSRRDLEVIARFGCPSTDRKVVNAGKRLRDFLAIDEISVCRPCALRASCERRDFKPSAEHVSGTPEVVRLLSQYALEVSPFGAKEGLQIPPVVQQSCVNLLRECMALGAVPRDPKLPKPQKSLEPVKMKSTRERDSKRRSKDDVEMKPGDWRCEECKYVNFARNRRCRECDAVRPVPEMRPGDWRCPECDFVNFSRNEVCHDCKARKPAGAGNESSFDRGSRYQRGAPQETGDRYQRGDRYDRGSPRDRRSSDARSYDRGSERASYGRSESRGYDRDRERDSDRSDGWSGGQRESFGRSRERGGNGLDRRSGGDSARGTAGQRTKFEEWKPDLKRRGRFEDDEEFTDRSARLRRDIDDGEDETNKDFDFSDAEDDDEDMSDVDPLEDEEFEDMKPARGRGREAGGRSLGRSEDKDPWWENDSAFRNTRGGRSGDFSREGRGSRSSSRESESDRSSGYASRGPGRGSRGGRGGGGRGGGGGRRGGGGGRGGGRGARRGR